MVIRMPRTRSATVNQIAVMPVITIYSSYDIEDTLLNKKKLLITDSTDNITLEIEETGETCIDQFH